MEDAVIVSAVRTPVGSFAGQFKVAPAAVYPASQRTPVFAGYS